MEIQAYRSTRQFASHHRTGIDSGARPVPEHVSENDCVDPTPILDGPRPPESVPPPPEHRVQGLIPYVHVEDVDRSIAFYHHLGFAVTSIYKYRQVPVWAELRSEDALLMVSRDGDPIDPAGQGVLFYLYALDLAALRAQLLANGVLAGEIEDGTPAPKEQMKVTDPDGYVLMVAQIDPEEE
jgi:Glyoxalase/Bleomycin resistance protein/Dioxygenase superfamily